MNSLPAMQTMQIAKCNLLNFQTWKRDFAKKMCNHYCTKFKLHKRRNKLSFFFPREPHDSWENYLNRKEMSDLINQKFISLMSFNLRTSSKAASKLKLNNHSPFLSQYMLNWKKWLVQNFIFKLTFENKTFLYECGLKFRPHSQSAIYKMQLCVLEDSLHLWRKKILFGFQMNKGLYFCLHESVWKKLSLGIRQEEKRKETDLGNAVLNRLTETATFSSNGKHPCTFAFINRRW